MPPSQLLRDGQTAIADIRGCVNSPANSVAAANYAVLLGYDSIYLSALYHDIGEEEPTIFLISPFFPEYTCLQDMTYEDWFMNPRRDHHLFPPDRLSDLSMIPGIRSVWLEFLNPPEAFPTACSVALQLIPANISLLFSTNHRLASVPDGVSGVDPEGKLGFKPLDRPNNILDDFSLSRKPGSIRPKTVSFDGHPSAQYIVVPIP